MSLIIKKYDYTTLKKTSVNGKRLYQVPTGNPLPSVTTILDSTKDKTHLYEWRRRVGEKKAQEITTEASNVGTRMHKCLENFIDTGVWPKVGSNPYAIQANAMAKVIQENAFNSISEILGSEVNLWVPNLYAGTTDLVCTYKNNLAICDFKQTNKPKKQEWVEDYYLQLVAYAEAHNELFHTQIKEGHIFMCSRNLEYQQFDLTAQDYKKWRSIWYDRLHTFYENY